MAEVQRVQDAIFCLLGKVVVDWITELVLLSRSGFQLR